MRALLFAFLFVFSGTFAYAELRLVEPSGKTKAPAAPMGPPAPVATVSEPSSSGSGGSGFGSVFSTYHSSRFQLGVELLGPGLLYSFGGSFLLTDHVALNAGVSFFSVSASANPANYASATATTIPLSISALAGGPDHHLEFLVGASPILGTGELSLSRAGVNRAAGRTVLGFGGIGYRYWPDLGGFHFRATGYLMVAKGLVFPWAGFQFGYAF